ncbi:MAG: ATP-binding cassette domain-containing protein [Chloracidobacterium sp.]|nr:ATP-binding cassette domain-containing protein [Chloracidobacterium sp.]
MFITANNVSFSYTEDKQVLQNVSLSLERGETLAIVGASGCGKSTLLRILSGILPNSPGNQLSGDISIDNLTADDYRKAGRLAFMFQEPTLMPNLNVRDNVAFPLKIKGTKYGNVDDLIETVGLKEFSNYLPKNLSGGMKTRVALSRSFVSEPELLFLDEPFAALDIAWKSRLYVELENLVDRFGTTVMFVTHDVQEALLLSDTVLVLGNTGHVKAHFHIETNRSISDRVRNISGYMSEVYSKYMLPIQDAIMNGNGVGSHESLQKSNSSLRVSKEALHQ